MNVVIPPPAALLDTCAVVWLANGTPIPTAALDAIVDAGRNDGIFVSPISAWEIGMLDRRSRPAGLRFLPDPRTWFARFLTGMSVKLAVLTPEIAIDASFLPKPLHGDPADRLLIATARNLGMPIVTRDRKIRAYADLGHLRVIPC